LPNEKIDESIHYSPLMHVTYSLFPNTSLISAKCCIGYLLMVTGVFSC